MKRSLFAAISPRIGVAGLNAVIAVLILGSSVFSYGQDEQPSAIQVPLVLRHHVMVPAPPGTARSQSSSKPQLRVAANAQSQAVNTGIGVVYTCASNVATSTCNYLNTVVAGYYNSVFTNANANIYVQYGNTGLGSSVGYINLVNYTPYVTALTSNTHKSSIQTSALSAINTHATPIYGTQNTMEVTVALGSALGFTGLLGINAAETASCTPYTASCYNEIVTVADATNQANGGFTLYYDDQGGTEAAGQYDFYAVVEHETDEVLGTSSCISTQSASLSDECDFAGGTGVPSAVDLERFDSPGVLAKDTTPSTAAGQYFSYDGGAHYGAYGHANTPLVYNTLSNGEDFADYISSSPDCGTNEAVQDATGCPGEDAGLTVVNDGQSELTILNAIGFKTPEAVITSPTPGSTLPGSSATFTWSAVSGATAYWVYVGTTGVGSSDIFSNIASITATSQAVIGLPASGKVYVRVYSYVGGFWTSIDYTYTAGSTPAVSLSTTGLFFASTNFGSTTAAQTVTIKNTGTATLTLTSETLTGTNPTSFVISANTCTTSLAVNATCAVSVEFKPTGPGALTASLSIADNATGSPQAVALSGNGLASVITLTPTSVTFPGTTTVNTTDATTELVTVKNTGNLAANITSIAITGTNSTSFSETTTCASTLGVGGSCGVTLTFKPLAGGTLTATLAVNDDATTAQQTATITGTGASSGTPGITLSATSLTFPNTIDGASSVMQTITVKNTGTAAANLTSIALGGTNPHQFKELTTCGTTLAASASCAVYISLKPTLAQALSAILSITDNAAGSPQQVTLSGTGAAAPPIGLSVTSLAFPATTHGTVSLAMPVRITNNGTATVHLISIAITGTNPTSFTQINNCATTLAPAASCMAFVAFDPTVAGALSANLTFTDNGAASPQSVTLSGTGN